MTQYRSSQRGFLSIGAMYLIATLGFIALLLVKLGPAYLNHYKVSASLKSLAADSSVANKTRDEIGTMLRKRWQVDSVDGVSTDDVSVRRDIGKITVQVAYDVSTPILGNVSALIHFDDAVEVSNQ